MTDRIFIDSNIWLYLFLKDSDEKYRISEKYFLENFDNSILFITFQVINEVSNILIKKHFSENIVKENIERMYRICTIQDISKEIVFDASELRETYSVSFWDSIIISSAIKSNCNILASEDLQDGLKIKNTVIKNIYKK